MEKLTGHFRTWESGIVPMIKKEPKHSRSKSQTFISATATTIDVDKHFERSLNENYHSKSKSLPRPMAGE